MVSTRLKPVDLYLSVSLATRSHCSNLSRASTWWLPVFRISLLNFLYTAARRLASGIVLFRYGEPLVNHGYPVNGVVLGGTVYHPPRQLYVACLQEAAALRFDEGLEGAKEPERLGGADLEFNWYKNWYSGRET